MISARSNRTAVEPDNKFAVKQWEIRAGKLSKAGCNWRCEPRLDNSRCSRTTVSTNREGQRTARRNESSYGGLETNKFATGRIRRGGPPPQLANNP